MRHTIEFLKSALVTGLLIVLPAWLAVLQLAKLLVKLDGWVKPLDVPVTTMMKCISKWGTGSGELLAGLPANPKLPASLS